jgi:hypothetical protein
MNTLLNEELAREMIRQLSEQVERERRIRQLLNAKRLARQAEQAAARARLALARAI